MIFGILFLTAAAIFAAHFTYISWILPWLVRRDTRPREAGRDDAVSYEELRRRKAWRYDDWMSRSMAIIIDIVLIAFIVLAIARL